MVVKQMHNKNKRKYCINGKFLGRRLNGQIRVAIEIIKELDRIVQKDEIEIIAPESEYSIDGLNNIEIIRYGKCNIHIWEQTFYLHYIIVHNRKGINFLNTHPFFRPDICYVHDVIFKAYPKLYNGLYGKLQKIYILLMIYSSLMLGEKIITVSKFSKDEILKYYHINSEKIHIIYNGWQHMNHIEKDDSVFEELKVKKGEYCLAVSGLTPQKNFQWVIENAKYNSELSYIIAGSYEGASPTFDKVPNNVHFIGRVSDGRLKSLMKNCKVFIHPAIYEGFGMTPLEALSVGARVIVSNAACLPEIYGNAVAYIDPMHADIKINRVISEYEASCKKESIDMILNKYKWSRAAEEVKGLL